MSDNTSITIVICTIILSLTGCEVAHNHQITQMKIATADCLRK